MLADTVDNIYHVLGADGIARITAAFYHLVSTDDLLRPLYPEADLSGAETRLRDFLTFRFGYLYARRPFTVVVTKKLVLMVLLCYIKPAQV